MCQRKDALIHSLINELPPTKDRRPSSYKQYLQGCRVILSSTALSLLRTMWAGTRVEAPQVGETDKGERGDSPILPCLSLHAHMGSTEICIQLGNTRQLWLHACTHAGWGVGCAPQPTPDRMPGNTATHPPHLHPKLKPEVLPCRGEPTKNTKPAPVFSPEVTPNKNLIQGTQHLLEKRIQAS